MCINGQVCINSIEIDRVEVIPGEANMKALGLTEVDPSS